MRQPPRHRRLMIALMGLGLAGLVGLLTLSAHAPEHAALLRLLAVAWFALFGAARLLVQLDQAVSGQDEAVQTWTRLRGRGDL